MGLLNVSLVLFTTALLLAFIVADLPEYIQVCQANDNNIANCINNSVNLLRPYLKVGIPELNVPPLEPLLLDEIKLKRGPSAAAVNANISELKVWGPTGFIVTELKPDIARSKFNFKVLIPHLHFEGNYIMDMRILLIKIRGRGPIQGNFTNYHFDVSLKGHRIVKNGEEYLKFDKMRLKLHIGKAKIQLGNLFNNDPVLGRATNHLVNENSEIFLHEILPVLENSLADKFTDIANKITLKFTYKELFP